MIENNYHTHTYRCKHASGSDEDYVKAAIKAGFKTLGFADHTPWNFNSSFVSTMRMEPKELPGYIQSIRRLQKKYKNQINIKLGLECELYTRYLDWLKEIVKEYQVEYLIFGNHFYETEEHYPYFGSNCDSQEYFDLYVESTIKAMESDLFSYIAHPDLFMRSFNSFNKSCVEATRKICKAANKHQIPLEYNIGYMKHNEQHNIKSFPCDEFWQIAADEKCITIIGYDAHTPEALTEKRYITKALQRINQLGLKRTEQINFLH